MDYRSADMIELHDANMIVRTQTASETENGWREYPHVGGLSYSINGSVIEKLAKHFGLETQDAFQSFTSPKTGERTTFRSLLRQSNFEIGTTRKIVGDRSQEDSEGLQLITCLLVRTTTHNILDIKITFELEYEDGNVDTFEKEITYSGKYTIWWTRDSDAQ